MVSKRKELMEWLVNKGLKDPKDPLTFMETKFWQQVKDVEEANLDENDPDFGSFDEECAYHALKLLTEG